MASQTSRMLTIRTPEDKNKNKNGLPVLSLTNLRKESIRWQSTFMPSILNDFMGQISRVASMLLDKMMKDPSGITYLLLCKPLRRA